MLHIISFLLLVAVTNAQHFCEPAKDPWELCNDPSRGHFLVADPTHCQIFYSCEPAANNSHVPHTLQCMEGHGFNDNLFNENFWRCDYKNNVPRCSCTQRCKVGEEFERNCYLLIDTPKSWLDAQVDCQARNGSLASVSSAAVNTFIANLSGPNTWIGASDADEEGVWEWSNGDDFKYSNWATGEPDNSGGTQDCAVINWSITGEWDDQACGQQSPFICQGQTF